MFRDADEVEDVWKELSEMPIEQLESFLLKNPVTGKPDGLYTLLMQTVTEANIKYLCERDNVSPNAVKEWLGGQFLEAGYPLPQQLLN
jgi:hypothetical protein